MYLSLWLLQGFFCRRKQCVYLQDLVLMSVIHLFFSVFHVLLKQYQIQDHKTAVPGMNWTTHFVLVNCQLFRWKGYCTVVSHSFCFLGLRFPELYVHNWNGDSALVSDSSSKNWSNIHQIRVLPKFSFNFVKIGSFVFICQFKIGLTFGKWFFTLSKGGWSQKTMITFRGLTRWMWGGGGGTLCFHTLISSSLYPPFDF